MKIYIAVVDVKSNKKIISLKVVTDDEHIHDEKVLHRLVQDITKSKHVIFEKVFADGTYDSNVAVFRDLADSRSIPYIKVTRKTRTKKTNNIFRNLLVLSQNNDLQKWKDNSIIYGGQRWMAETVFSCIKGHLENILIQLKLRI